MSLDTWLLYVATILVFMASPGPSHLLMISVGMGNGFRKSLATAAGDLSANAVQIVLAGFGLAAVLVTSRYGFVVVKWLGVAYLVWLGSKTLLASFSKRPTAQTSEARSCKSLWLRGFVTSAANPKAVVFFAALFPQFIDPTASLALQVLVLGMTYIVIDGVFLACYGYSAGWLAGKLKAQSATWVTRLSGTSLIVSAIMLGMRNNDAR